MAEESATTQSPAASHSNFDSPQTATIHLEDSDPEHPHNLTAFRKWMAVMTVSLGSLCVTCTSSIYSVTYGQITKEFKISQEIATLGLSLFIWGMGIGPLVLSPLSELYGRRIIYLVSYGFFLVWVLPCALARNVQTLLIGRFMSGFSGSAFLSVAGGTVGDMFSRHELAFPMMVYTASPFIGPEVGPLIGGFINQYTNWRWTFYTILCWAAAVLLLVYCFVPETYQPVLLSRKAQRIRKQISTSNSLMVAPNETNSAPLKALVLHSLYRPLMLLILEPMCLSLCLYSATLLGIIYLFFGSFQLVFGQVYGFELWQRGVSFMGLLVGMLIAMLSEPLWRRLYGQAERSHQSPNGRDPESMPEWRLPPAILGAPLVTAGLFVFAWTAYPSIHWIVPITGSALFGAGTILVFTGVFTFLVDAYPAYAASALAANSFTRSTFAGIFPLFGTQMYHRLGIQWASCLLALLTLVMLPLPYVFYRYGAEIRKKSRFSD